MDSQGAIIALLKKEIPAGGILAICKQTGKILYDGSDGME